MAKKQDDDHGVSRKRTGFDAPRTTRTEDRLGRWPFASSVYRLATDVSDGWSVRVGVYGPWGSGKTTILHLIEEQADKDGHAVMWFNPWQFDDQDRLVEGFFASLAELVSQIEGKQLDPATWTTANAGAAAKLFGKLKPGFDAAGVGGKLVHGGAELALKALKVDAKKLRKLSERLKEKRLLVLVDDLDRAHPAIVPRVFFWLKELFDLPGLSFVMAFDIDRVVPVLSAHHPGFDGRDFLEKIIDFHRWLPALSPEQILSLALAERADSADFVPEAAVRGLADCFPDSPRATRAIFRHARAVRAEVMRHHGKEVDLQLLLAVEILRGGWPLLFERLRADGEFHGKLMFGALFADKKPGQSRFEATAEQVARLAEEVQPVEHRDLPRLNRLLVRVRASVGFLIGGPSFEYHAYLLDRPRAVTHGEFAQLVQGWKDAPAGATLRPWIDQHSAARGVDAGDVVQELLDAAASMWKKALDTAAGVTRSSDREAASANADLAIEIWRCICFELTPGDGARQLDWAGPVVRFAETIASWWNFEEELYRRRVRAGQQLIGDVIGAAHVSASGLVPLLTVPRAETGVAGEFYSPLAERLRSRVARDVVDALKGEAQIQALFQDMDTWLWDQLVTRVTGPVWKGDLRDEVLTFLRTATDDRRSDVAFLLRCLMHRLSTSDHVLVLDAEVRELLWSASTPVPLNPRIRGTLDAQRKDLLRLLGSEGEKALKLPTWWDSGTENQRVQMADPEPVSETER